MTRSSGAFTQSRPVMCARPHSVRGTYHTDTHIGRTLVKARYTRVYDLIFLDARAASRQSR